MSVDNMDIASMSFACKVRLDDEFNNTYFNVGKMSNTLVFDLDHAIPVTLWKDPSQFSTLIDAHERFYLLKTHKSDHVSKVSGIDMARDTPFIMLDDVVRHTLGSWIIYQSEEYEKNEDGQKWLNVIGNNLYPYLRDFALGVLELQNSNSTFDGTLDDLHISDAGLRIAKLVDCSNQDFDRMSRGDVVIFRQVVHYCVFFPIHKGNFVGNYNFSEDQCTQVGVNKDIATLLGDLRDTSRLTKLPPSAFLDHPALFCSFSVDKTTYSRKLNLDILFVKNDPTVAKLDQIFFDKGIFWKENLPGGSVKDCLYVMEENRVESKYGRLSKAELKRRVLANLKKNLFRDFVKLFFNCEKHMDRFELVNGNWEVLSSEEIIDLVDRNLGRGSLSLIHSMLLDFWGLAIINGPTYSTGSKGQYLMQLRCWCFAFLRSNRLC